ncbi:hypothetical protein [Pseudomonas laurylsulfatiphila]|uniref:hypothetical protein n=1 Tax=Pseudomonas laurylsulfatiphila TaxID=2011015 RepID=UPI003D1E47E9|nr:hypothetical protein [Pseudomonas reinekei]
MPRYFVLAKGTKALPLSGNYPWPYEVSLCFEAVAWPVGFSEGVGHGAAGGVFTAQEALHAKWREHIAAAKGEWLLPFIEQLAAGVHLDASSLLAIAAAKLGEPPEGYEFRND